MDAFEFRDHLLGRIEQIEEIIGTKAVLMEILCSMGNGEINETVKMLERLYDEELGVA